MRYPNLNEEKKLWNRGYKKVVGIDEAGRGPLAGPVFVAAVILNYKYQITNSKQILSPKFQIIKEITDSKKLIPKKREKIYKILINSPNIEWKASKVSEKVIDKINVKNATELAMERCILKFKRKPDFLIIDGKHLGSKKLKEMDYKMIINADEKVFSCAAASIIAKVRRDRFMKKLHKKYPKYNFDTHKGYGTRSHKKKIKKHGPCKVHRRSFRPIKKSTIEKF